MESCRQRHLHPACSGLQTTPASHSGFKPHTTFQPKPAVPRFPHRDILSFVAEVLSTTTSRPSPNRVGLDVNKTHMPKSQSLVSFLIDWLLTTSKAARAASPHLELCKERVITNVIQTSSHDGKVMLLSIAEAERVTFGEELIWGS